MRLGPVLEVRYVDEGEIARSESTARRRLQGSDHRSLQAISPMLFCEDNSLMQMEAPMKLSTQNQISGGLRRADIQRDLRCTKQGGFEL